jgi:hypothetical protein
LIIKGFLISNKKLKNHTTERQRLKEEKTGKTERLKDGKTERLKAGKTERLKDRKTERQKY